MRPVDVWFSARRKIPKNNPIKTFHEVRNILSKTILLIYSCKLKSWHVLVAGGPEGRQSSSVL